MTSSRLLRRHALPGTLAAAAREMESRGYMLSPTPDLLLYFRESHHFVYQGGVEGIVSTEKLEDPRASLTDAVAHVFEGYPFVASQSAPVAPAGSGQ